MDFATSFVTFAGGVAKLIQLIGLGAIVIALGLAVLPHMFGGLEGLRRAGGALAGVFALGFVLASIGTLAVLAQSWYPKVEGIPNIAVPAAPAANPAVQPAAVPKP